MFPFIDVNQQDSVAEGGTVLPICLATLCQSFKGIVSQDWGELQMIPVDSLEVFSIAGSYFYSFLTMFSCLNLQKRHGIWLSLRK